MPTVPSQDLVFVRWGVWSYCAQSLRDALRTRVRVREYDLMPLARRPQLLPARVRAWLEARRAGRDVPWVKTAAWSSALQRTLRRSAVLRGRTVLFCQTIPAWVPEQDVRYAVYTDRVGVEGAAGGGPFASRFTAAWLARERAFLLGAHRIYTMGPSTHRVLLSHYGVATEKVRVVGTAPNLRLGPAINSSRCRVLLFVGTDWRMKGGPELLRAFADARRDFADLTLKIVGSRPRGPVGEGVEIVGRVPLDQMDRYYSSADALVIPTHLEGFGNSFLEGLIKGLPCIGTQVGNLPWLIRDAGVCIPPGSVSALARAIRQVVIHYPRLRLRAHERGSDLRTTFTWEGIAATITEDLLGERRPQGVSGQES